MRSIVWCAVGLLTLGAAAGAEPRGLTAEDLVTMDRISAPRVSPDGASVVFVRRVTDLAADRGRTDLWRVGSDGTGLRRLTTHEASDGSPAWTAAGDEIYFLSSRSGSSQVWALPADGGEARQVTALPLDVGAFVLGATGRLAVTMEVFADCETLACTVERLAARGDSKASGRVYDRLLVRHWDTWKDGRRSHLFAVDPQAPEGARDLMPGMDADAPSKPFGGGEEIAFTRDGSTLVFSARDAGAGEAWSTDFDLYRVPFDGSAAPENLTPDNPAWDTQPVFSPDGRTLAWLAMARAGYESDRFRVVVRPWAGGEPAGPAHVLTEAWDRSPGSLVFAAGGGEIYATANDTGEVRLFAVDAASARCARSPTAGTFASRRSPATASSSASTTCAHRSISTRFDATAPTGGGSPRSTPSAWPGSR